MSTKKVRVPAKIKRIKELRADSTPCGAGRCSLKFDTFHAEIDEIINDSPYGAGNGAAYDAYFQSEIDKIDSDSPCGAGNIAASHQ